MLRKVQLSPMVDDLVILQNLFFIPEGRQFYSVAVNKENRHSLEVEAGKLGI